MRFLCMIAGVATLVGAITLPQEYVEGTYTVTYDDAGNEVHTRIAGPIAPRGQDGGTVADAATRGVAEQSTNGYYAFCFCSHKLNAGDTDAAVADLKSQFPQDKHYDGSPNYYSIRGSVVAYACNVKGKIFVQNATPLLITQMLDKVSNQCGRYVGGWGMFTEGPLQDPWPAHFGYMNYKEGLNFCREGTNILQSHC
ncbi:hypothetical protein JDV02_007608 [Purpureocillium takamizusanense]|uniref:Uncharacterized protein n=1 Tax=Purpureocillium takamizusanense TaxID=2060973 RepID=A0A9Q8VEB1_9HYPO|nr:uncharacterized protein JDV02_007608 [Purpureocillium takamizusanense]UNI21632.1 hypothetical protein JDV02_007608 [Purpureocillium takamizusanense]